MDSGCDGNRSGSCVNQHAAALRSQCKHIRECIMDGGGRRRHAHNAVSVHSFKHNSAKPERDKTPPPVDELSKGPHWQSFNTSHNKGVLETWRDTAWHTSLCGNVKRELIGLTYGSTTTNYLFFAPMTNKCKNKTNCRFWMRFHTSTSMRYIYNTGW